MNIYFKDYFLPVLKVDMPLCFVDRDRPNALHIKLWVESYQVEGCGLVSFHCILLMRRHSGFTVSLSLSTHEGNWVPVNYQKNSTECWGASCEGSAPYARRISVITVA